MSEERKEPQDHFITQPTDLRVCALLDMHKREIQEEENKRKRKRKRMYKQMKQKPKLSKTC
jgi:hypothetical protein